MSIANLIRLPLHDSAARAFSTGEKTSFGGLSDQDRIFTNLYGQNDPGLKVREMSGQKTLRRRIDRAPQYGIELVPGVGTFPWDGQWRAC